ncbi:MAG TPA: hypothetical protein VI451_16105 [Anaerolineales bacterium]|nr:hypothetical protein [Anaerolineales bacterium]
MPCYESQSDRLVFQHLEHLAGAALIGSGAIAGEEKQIQTWLAAIEAGDKPRVFFDSGEGDPCMLDQAKVLAGLLDEAGILYLLHVGEGGHT